MFIKCCGKQSENFCAEPQTRASTSGCIAQTVTHGLIQTRTLLPVVCQGAKTGCTLPALTSIPTGLWLAKTKQVKLSPGHFSSHEGHRQMCIFSVMQKSVALRDSASGKHTCCLQTVLNYMARRRVMSRLVHCLPSILKSVMVCCHDINTPSLAMMQVTSG